MREKTLSQEGLKGLACLAMLVDHMGVILFPQIWLRVVGRIAFPIFCFLLVEGIEHTGNPKKYGQRLIVAMILSEIPFNLMHGRIVDFSRQSVMVTLLLGFLTLVLTKDLCCPALKLSAGLFAAMAAELLHTDYGAQGVLVILLFGYAREYQLSLPAQTAILAVICLIFPCYNLYFGNIPVPIELFAVFAMVPIALYGGKKRTHSKMVQWGFYLFYPVHMLILSLLRWL